MAVRLAVSLVKVAVSVVVRLDVSLVKVAVSVLETVVSEDVKTSVVGVGVLIVSLNGVLVVVVESHLVGNREKRQTTQTEVRR